MAPATTSPDARIFHARRWIAALLCALVVLAAGCGTGAEPGAGTGTTTGPTSAAAKKEYEESITGIMEQVISASQELLTQSSSVPDFKARAPFLDTAATAYGAAGDSLDDVTPPGDVKSLHQRLLEASRALAVATKEAAAGAKKDDKKAPEAYSKAVTKYQTDLTEIQGEFSALGYSFPAGEAPETSTTPTTPTTPATPTTPVTPTTSVPTIPTPTTTPTTPPPTAPPVPDSKGLEKNGAPKAGSQKN